MADEKFRRERADRAPMQKYARAMLIVSIVQIVFSCALHIMDTVDQLLLILVGIAGLVGGVTAAFLWPSSRAFRNLVRGVVLGVPLLVMVLGVFSAIYASVYNPDSSPLYNWELYGSLAAQFTQLMLVFGLPALVAAASFGAKSDRVFLNIASIVHAACVAFITYYMAGDMGSLDFTIDLPVAKLLYVVLAFVFAGLTFVPALGNDPDHTIVKKN